MSKILKLTDRRKSEVRSERRYQNLADFGQDSDINPNPKSEIRNRSLGDYSVGVPPLPIPNREVKPDSADGTAIVGE